MTDTVEEERIKLKEIIIEELANLNWPELPMNMDPPEGDLSIICFPVAKKLGKAPGDVANELAEHLLKATSIEKIEAVNGYCNVTIDWINLMPKIVNEMSDYKFGKGENKKENVSPKVDFMYFQYFPVFNKPTYHN